MKLLLLIALVLSILACSKQDEDKLEVKSIDQVTGAWQWVSTCGGIIQSCEYASDTNCAVINFGSNGKYMELHNGSVYKEADYILLKINETTGTLRFHNNKYESSVRIVNSQLEIGRGELIDIYKRIK